MKKTLAVIILILIMIAALALGLVIGGMIAGNGFDPDETIDLDLTPSTGTWWTGEDPSTEKDTQTFFPESLPPLDDFTIPSSLDWCVSVDGEVVSLTWGTVGVTFPKVYRLNHVDGSPSLIAPDGSGLRIGYEKGAKDVTKLTKADADAIVESVLSRASGAKLQTQTDWKMETRSFATVASFSFGVSMGKMQITYDYLLFSDETRLYTVIVTRMGEDGHDFASVLATLETRKELFPPEETTDEGVVLPPDDFFDDQTTAPVVTDPPVLPPPDDTSQTDPPQVDPPQDGYVIPPAFKDSATMVGDDQVKLTFGKYAVTFPATYQLVDLGDGMPTLVAPDGSRATLDAKPDSGTYQDVVNDASGMKQYQSAFVSSFGGTGLAGQTPPMYMPMSGKDLVLSTATFTKNGTAYQLQVVVFIEDGVRHTVTLATVQGGQYTFGELLGTIEKA